MVMQCAGHDLRCRSRSPVDQNHKRLAVCAIASLGAKTAGFLRSATPRGDDFAARHERTRNRDGLVEQSAGIVAEVDHVACKLVLWDLLRDLPNRSSKGVGSLLVERGDPDVTDV